MFYDMCGWVDGVCLVGGRGGTISVLVLRDAAVLVLVIVLVQVSLCMSGLLFSFILGGTGVGGGVSVSGFLLCELLTTVFSPASCSLSSSSRSSLIVLHDSKYLLMRFIHSFSSSARGIHSLKRRSWLSGRAFKVTADIARAKLLLHESCWPPDFFD